MLADKLGLCTLDRAGDESLVRDLFGVLQQTETDMTLFFRGLAVASAKDIEPLRAAFYRTVGRPMLIEPGSLAGSSNTRAG